MDSNRIFIGNIMRCTGHQERPLLVMESFGTIDSFGSIETTQELAKENAILLKTKHGYYVDVEGLSLFDIMYLYLEDDKCITSGTMSWKLFMGTFSGLYVGELFVDRDTLHPYVLEKPKVSIRTLGKESEKK